MTTSTTHDNELDLQAEIIRQLWYVGHATPQTLANVLEQPVPHVQAALHDLSRRGFVFQFIRASDAREPDATYCLTRSTIRRVERLLTDTSRYRLRRTWQILQREDLVPLLAT